jgi:hypothetical protein
VSLASLQLPQGNRGLLAHASTSPLAPSSVSLTSTNDGQSRQDALWSPDGRVLAFCKPVPAQAADGKPLRNYARADFTQIFTLAVPELRAFFP